MTTYIVGTDGSETARRAAERAAALALARGAAVHVVCAYTEARPLDPADTSRQSALVTAEQIVEDQLIEYRRAGLSDATGAAIAGKPAEVILAEAERLDVAMIVVGNRGMRGLARLVGSVANHIAHHAPCDVLIVKTD